MVKVKINAEERKVTTKHILRDLRQKGYVPGVLYGQKIGSIPISLEGKEVQKIDGAQLLELVLPDKSYSVVISEVQKHPVKGYIRHIDFHQVSKNQKIRSEIPIQVIGEPEGIKQGGILQLGERIVEIETLPQDLPNHIEVDVSSLKLGDKYTLRDLQEDNKELNIISNDYDNIIAMVAVPKDNVEEETNESVEGNLEGEAVNNQEA